MMLRARRAEIVRRALGLTFALALTACSSRSEIVVRVDSDYRVGSELGMVEVTIAPIGGGTVWSHTFEFGVGTGAPLPLSLGIVPQNGDASRRVRVLVRGLRTGGGQLVEWTREVGFRAGETVLLDVFLARACEGVTCPSSQVCDLGVCRAIDAPVVLPSIRPGDELDAARPDAGPEPDTGPHEDASLCRFGACDLAMDDCPEGRVCAYGRSGSEFATLCRYDTLDLPRGAACGANTECGRGMFCDWDQSLATTTTCIPYCCAGLDCAEGEVCLAWADARLGELPVGGCSRDDHCDPIARTGCPSRAACYFRRAVTFCAVEGAAADGASCGRDPDCTAGSACFFSLRTGDMRCRTLCDHRSPVCPAGFSCVVIHTDAPYENLGVCD